MTGMEITDRLPVHKGKNSGGQVNIFGTIPKERLKYCLFPLVLISGTVMDRQKQ